jgi:hypothetical protein
MYISSRRLGEQGLVDRRGRLFRLRTGALGYFERSLAWTAPTDSIVRKLYALIDREYQMTGDSQAALLTCSDGLVLDPEDAELWFRKTVVHRHRGESSDSESCCRRILTLERRNESGSVDQRIYGHLTRRNHSYLDLTSGAALATRELLELITSRGWDCRALIPPRHDPTPRPNCPVRRASPIELRVDL